MANCRYRKQRSSYTLRIRPGFKIDRICPGRKTSLGRACFEAYVCPFGICTQCPLISFTAGGPLPRFDGIPGPPSGAPNAAPSVLQPQTSGPIRVPPLTQEKVAQYSSLFQESGAQGGILSGTRPHVKMLRLLICLNRRDRKTDI